MCIFSEYSYSQNQLAARLLNLQWDLLFRLQTEKLVNIFQFEMSIDVCSRYFQFSIDMHSATQMRWSDSAKISDE